MSRVHEIEDLACEAISRHGARAIYLGPDRHYPDEAWMVEFVCQGVTMWCSFDLEMIYSCIAHPGQLDALVRFEVDRCIYKAGVG